MTLASSTITSARFKIHDENSTYFDTDSYLLTIINDIIQEVYSTLLFAESTLVYDHTTVTTTTGTTGSTNEVSLSISHAGIMKDGVWRVGYETPLLAVVESDRRHFNTDGATGTAVVSKPTAYYLTQNNSTMGFLHIPDNAYTFNVFYWKETPELSATTESLPFDGMFDRYIAQKLVVELLEIMERDNSRAAILAQNEWDKAMTRVYSTGLKPRKSVSNMFAISGI